MKGRNGQKLGEEIYKIVSVANIDTYAKIHIFKKRNLLTSIYTLKLTKPKKKNIKNV